MKTTHSIIALLIAAVGLNPARAQSEPPAAPKTPEKWIGVTAGGIPDMTRAHLPKLPENEGLMVFSVAKESPALVAGIERFDIILRADGQPLSKPQDLAEMLNRRNFGTQMRLELIHKGAPKQVYAIVLEKPAGEATPGMGRGGIFGSAARPENLAIQFTYTDADGRRQSLSAKSMAEFGQRAQSDEQFRNKVQRMFQELPKNPQGITVVIRPNEVQPEPDQPKNP